MNVEVKSSNGYYVASITLKSGNRYTYSAVLDEEPTESQVKLLWLDGRRYWSRSK